MNPTIDAGLAICGGCGARFIPVAGATSGLCCSCRKLRRECQESAPRSPVDPKAFDSQAALDAWYDADALRCHICGGEFAGLYRHVSMAHGISARDYKIRFGIPMGYGLAGRATRIKHRRSAAATAGKMAASGFANLDAARASKRGARIAWTPYQARDQVARMIESPAHPSNKVGSVEVRCTVCGDPFPVPASIGPAYQCRAKCDSCKG